MDFKLMINNKGRLYDATDLCEGEILLTSQRKDSPAKLEFSIVKDEIINYQEGNEATFAVDGVNMFSGVVVKKRRNKDQIIETTAYDQIFYLIKNKKTYVYTRKKASELLQMIAGDFNLKTGAISDTGYVIPARSEDIKTLMDIMQTAMDLTVINTGKLFVLFDDFGKLTLKSIKEMGLPIAISADKSMIDFEYTTDIDSDTYNKIKLVRDNKNTKKRETYVAMDSGRMADWGILQLEQKVDENMNEAQIVALVNRMLADRNRVKRTLSVEELQGDPRVRAGNSLIVNIPSIGDINVNHLLLVEKCVHTIKNNEHTMKLNLSGGGLFS